MLGTYPEDYFESPYRETVRAALEDVRETRRPRRIEAAFVAPDGVEYAFEAKIAPLVKDDAVAHLLFNYNDVTHRKKLEDRLRRDEERMRLALENLPVLVNALSADLRILFWNRACEKATGYAAAEVLQTPDVWERLYPDEAVRRRLFRHLRPGPDIRDSEWEIRCKDGSRRVVSWSSFGGSCPIPGWSNWFVGIDVTEVRAARRTLEKRERLYRTLVDSLPDSITLCDMDGVVQTANRQAARLRGYDSEAELMAAAPTVYDLIAPEDRERLARETERSLKEGRMNGIEYRGLRKDGGTLPMELRVAFIPDENGRPDQIIGISRDLREKKAAEARIQHAARLASLGTIVGGVAHEINNPNHFIRMNAQGLQNNWKSLVPILAAHAENHPDFRVGAFGFRELLDRTNRAFENIRESSGRIAAIVEELKDYSRPAPFRADQLVDLEAVVSRAVRLLEFMRKKAAFHFETHFDETPPVRGNPQQLEQVVVNLLQNAFIAMKHRAGTVRLKHTTGETPGTVEIRVRDEGDGIPEADLEQVFDPFFTTRRADGGTGLGLWVADRIARDHGGRVLLENRSGRGALARVILPAARDEAGSGFDPA